MQGLLWLQKAIRARLVSNPGVLALVPAKNILDGGGRPKVFPSILLGEDQAVPWEPREIAMNSDVGYFRAQLYATLHVWAKGSLYSAKEIGAAVQAALHDEMVLAEGRRAQNVDFETARYINDPDGESVHGILTFHTMHQEPR